MGGKMYKKYLAGSLLAAALPAHADYVTVISLRRGEQGGAARRLLRTPSSRPPVPPARVVHGSYNGDLAKPRKMVQLSHVSWDVVEVEAPELARGCEEGLFEQLDASLLGDAADHLARCRAAVRGVGIFVWSTVLAYNGSKLKGAPQGWADFDTQRFPASAPAPGRQVQPGVRPDGRRRQPRTCIGCWPVPRARIVPSAT